MGAGEPSRGGRRYLQVRRTAAERHATGETVGERVCFKFFNQKLVLVRSEFIISALIISKKWRSRRWLYSKWWCTLGPEAISKLWVSYRERLLVLGWASKECSKIWSKDGLFGCRLMQTRWSWWTVLLCQWKGPRRGWMPRPKPMNTWPPTPKSASL